MPELIKNGYVYIAQPPLYKVKRKKREEYVENDDQMSKILIELGTEDARLFRMKDKKEFAGQPLLSVLESLQELAKLVDTIERRGIKFEDYLAARNKAGELPAYAMRIKEAGATRFEFACNDKEWSKLCDKYDINLDEETAPGEPKNGDKDKGPQVKPYELNESNSIQAVITALEKKGFNIEHYAAQEEPLFELVEGATPVAETETETEPKAKAEKADKKPKAKLEEKRIPIHSIPDILERIKDNGKRGLLIQRYKGLGEMNPEQLWETTMDPERRKMLKVELMDAADADRIFSILMGDEVEPRRQFIEEHALYVRNLDV